MNSKITYGANGANSVNLLRATKSDQQRSQKTAELRLIRSEIDTLSSLPSAHRNKSGFANFIFQLGEQIDPNTGSIRLTRDEVRRIPALHQTIRNRRILT
jgi:hypothetical protein